MGERVLIIDDEANIREMIRLTLEVAGYEVAEAEDGLEAFAILGFDPSWDVIDATDPNKNEKVFIVRRPDGSEQEVVVEISDDAFKEARQVIRNTTIDEEFWSNQTQTLLSDFIWNDGDVPAAGRITLKRVDPELTEGASRKD